VRRKRKTKYTWLPADGQSITVDTTTINITPFSVSNQITNELPSVVFTNVLADFPETDVDTSAVSLADAIGSEYVLKRLVGKVFVEALFRVDPGAATTFARQNTPTMLCTVGFFVAAADPDDTGQPVGSAAQQFKRYNPISVDAIREPWIWRRSWLLNPTGNIFTTSTSPIEITGLDENTNQDLGLGSFPPNNAAYGSVADGPHIDAKTARRIQLHERLWVSTSLVNMPEGTPLAAGVSFGAVQMTFELRALGALRRAHNRSSFK